MLQFGFRAIFLTRLCPSIHLLLHLFFFAINPIASLLPTYSLPCQMSVIITATINLTGNLKCFSIIKVKILLVSNASPRALLVGTKLGFCKGISSTTLPWLFKHVQSCGSTHNCSHCTIHFLSQIVDSSNNLMLTLLFWIDIWSNQFTWL